MDRAALGLQIYSAIHALCMGLPPMDAGRPPRCGRTSQKVLRKNQGIGVKTTFFGWSRGLSESLQHRHECEEPHYLARFFHLAVDYAKQIGFTGPFLIQPKPKEPTKHQYDLDAAACLNFLPAYDLKPYFKLNIETNHATLAGHTMMHELGLRRPSRRPRLHPCEYGRPIAWDGYPTNPQYITT